MRPPPPRDRRTIDFVRITAGRLAHREGATLADCPFAPGDPVGALWRREWIRAEAAARKAAGTFGATATEWETARAHFVTPPLPEEAP